MDRLFVDLGVSFVFPLAALFVLLLASGTSNSNMLAWTANDLP